MVKITIFYHLFYHFFTLEKSGDKNVRQDIWCPTESQNVGKHSFLRVFTPTPAHLMKNSLFSVPNAPLQVFWEGSEPQLAQKQPSQTQGILVQNPVVGSVEPGPPGKKSAKMLKW